MQKELGSNPSSVSNCIHEFGQIIWSVSLFVNWGNCRRRYATLERKKKNTAVQTKHVGKLEDSLQKIVGDFQ